MRNSLMAVLSLAAFIPGPASADLIVFSNYDPADGNGFNVLSGLSMVEGSNFGYYALAMPFTPSTTASLSGIDMALYWGYSVGTTNTGIVRLYTDDGSGTKPGSAIESFNISPTDVDSNSNATHVVSSLNPVLTAGTLYWLAALPSEDNSQLLWNRNTIGQAAIPAESLDGINWVQSEDSQVLGAFRILAIPEPAGVILLAIMAAGMVGYRARRQRGQR